MLLNPPPPTLRYAPDHPAYRDWVEETINGGGAYGVSELVLSGFICVVTHRKCLNVRRP